MYENKKKINKMIQKDLIDIVTKEWIDFFWNNVGKEVDKKAFEEGIKWLYEDILKISTPKIIYCDSPNEILNRFSEGQRNYWGLSDYPAIMGLTVVDCLNKGEYYDIMGMISTKINGIPFIYVSQMIDVEDYQDRLLSYDFYRSMSFYDYCYKIGFLKSPHFINYRNLIKSGVFQIYSTKENIYVLNFPIEIQVENNRPHSIKGPAIKFRDGTEYYFIRGVEIGKYIFKRVQDRSITLEEVLKIKNEEEKSAALLMYQELYGEQASYQFISESLKEVNSYSHETGDKTLCYTLFKGKLGEGLKRVAYVRCYCPSTDRMFFLGVDSKYRKAKDAIASLYRIPRKLKLHIKYINRQGERFTTVLTDIGERIRKNMTESDLKNLTTISGDDYFLFMRYEY